MSVLQIFTPEGRIIEMELTKEQCRDPLKILQEGVGGYIEPLCKRRTEIYNENFKKNLKGNVRLYMNDEGRDLPVNRHFLQKNYLFGDKYVKGNVVCIRYR
jgi:hypothetical protein